MRRSLCAAQTWSWSSTLAPITCSPHGPPWPPRPPPPPSHHKCPTHSTCGHYVYPAASLDCRRSRDPATLRTAAACLTPVIVLTPTVHAVPSWGLRKMSCIKIPCLSRADPCACHGSVSHSTLPCMMPHQRTVWMCLPTITRPAPSAPPAAPRIMYTYAPARPCSCEACTALLCA